MGEWTKLTTADGHELTAWAALPEQTPKGGIVIIQEIFGITGHIRSVADSYAAEGYAVIAPALFDRVHVGVELEYSDIPSGKAIVEQTEPAKSMADIAAAASWARQYGKVAVIGYCWGGTLAHLAAVNGIVDAAAAYYGGMVAKFLDRKPVVPTIYHFGGQDMHIPISDVDSVAQAMGRENVYVYAEAGHGFNCNERPDYREGASILARTRTLAFLRTNMSATG
jgi:carboxymethylenebutenolidase